MNNNIVWIREGRQLRAIGTVSDYSNPGMSGLTESLMDPVQAWSEENDCGIRISFDTWRFVNEQDITMFLLRWS